MRTDVFTVVISATNMSPALASPRQPEGKPEEADHGKGTAGL